MSGTFFEINRAICNRFNENWADHTPVRWPNAPFTRPDAAPYVAIDVMFGPGRQIDIGDVTTHRHTGFVQVGAFVPTDIGLADAYGLADRASAIFKALQVSDAAGGVITFRTPSIVRQGAGEGWAYVILNVEFQRDGR